MKKVDLPADLKYTYRVSGLVRFVKLTHMHFLTHQRTEIAK
jgi:hypothetical protein